MKKLLFLLFFFPTILCSQKQDSIISDSIIGHIYKPKLVKPTEARLAELQLPQGFRIEKFAEGLGKPRIIKVSPQGKVYVSRREGDVLLLQDSDQDGKADQQKTLVTKKGAHGMAFHDNMFYLITVNEVYRAALNEDGSIGELDCMPQPEGWGY